MSDTPETIYLIPDSTEGDLLGYLWCQDPAPGVGMDPRDAIEYRRADVEDTELAAAKARIAELEAQIKRESDARRKQKVTIDFARNQLDKAIAEHRQQQAKRIIELEKALEPLADIVTAFDEKYYDHHQTLVLMEAGDARRAAALLKGK